MSDRNWTCPICDNITYQEGHKRGCTYNLEQRVAVLEGLVEALAEMTMREDVWESTKEKIRDEVTYE